MNETRRPFACTIEGCEMTFTNEDHLNWHHKKHDMVLNLGLANKSADSATDQTPTPTRFIRNCEEVGLFQDLQNVNPFDETFKKAMEYAKCGTLLHVPDPSNDDTLHTPHIFPPMDENVIINRSDSHSRQSNDFSIITVPSINDNNHLDDDDNVTNTIDLTINEDTPASQSINEKSSNDLKDKLKRVIQNKEKNIQNKSLVITPVPLERLLSSETDNISLRWKSKSPPDSNTIGNTDDNGKEKIREMNRAAQFRCRKRKQQQWKKMEDDLKSVRADNAKLHTENLVLKQKMTIMKSIILKYKKTTKSNLLTELEKALSTPIQVVKKTKAHVNLGSLNAAPASNKFNSRNSPVKIAPIIPMPTVLQNAQNKPVIIQVLGTVSQLIPK